MLQAPVQTVGVFILNFLEPGQALGLCLFQHGGGCRRHHRDSHDEGGHQAVADAQGHGLQQAAHHAGGEYHRQKDAHRGEGGRHNGHAHLLCALHGCTGGGHAAAAQAVDVLDDDHRVIHQHTDAQGKARQRHDVQVETRKIHEHHGEQHRQRDADADHEGGLDVLQEDGQHEDGQRRAHQHAGEDALDQHIDIVALVGQHHHMQAVVLGFQLFERFQTVAGNGAGAGTVVLINFQHRGLLAVQAGEAVGGVVDDLHVRHIGQAHVAVAVHM